MVFIRTADIDDIAEISRMWEEMMDFHCRLDSSCRVSEKASDEFYFHIYNAVASERSHVLVADGGDGETVGYVYGYIPEFHRVIEKGACGHVSNIFVRENCRRKGIGSLLLEGILSWFEGMGIKEFECNTMVCNEVSNAFWESHGFKTCLLTRKKNSEKIKAPVV